MMNITVKTSDILPLEHNGRDDIYTVMMRSSTNHQRNFRCINCGRIICSIDGSPAHIQDDGNAPLNKNFIDINCHRCKTTYRFVL